jgi:hypothetical protein
MLSYISVHNVATSSCIHAFSNLMVTLTRTLYWLFYFTIFGVGKPTSKLINEKLRGYINVHNY